jgi:hypothetical protein
MSVSLVAAATGSVVMAEAPVRADEGKVEAIEIYRSPDNNPLNGGTLIGGIAAGVIAQAHSVLSFVFNIAVVAMSINVIGGVI